VEGRRKKKFKKKGAGRPYLGIDQWSPTGRGSIPGHDWPGPFFLEFFYFFQIFYWKFGKWALAFGRMGAGYNHFFKLPPTLGSIKSSIPHRVWRFYFFFKIIFPKFRVDLDLHIYRLDFRFMEN
jgi:hypothetical protein